VSEPAIFSRVICGVDGSPESLTAVRQAARLLDADGSLALIAVARLARAAQAGMAAVHAAELLQQGAEEALAAAQSEAPSASTKVVNGDPRAVLLREAESATLLALGSHGRRRAAGILLGTVAATMLQQARCSLLVARPARDAETWPQSVVVGVDGSTASATAFTIARLGRPSVRSPQSTITSTRNVLEPSRRNSRRKGGRPSTRSRLHRRPRI
jgi:nucleotide-binding universal stress UspA family protein